MASKTLFITLAAMVLLVAGCVQQPSAQTYPAIANAPQTQTELIHADVLGAGLSSTNVTVLGVRVGMVQSDVLKILGPADNPQEYDFGAIENWEYSKSLGLASTGLLVHFEHGIVTRIVVYHAMNMYLQGDSVINKTKEEVYSAFDVPSRAYDIKGGRYFVYNDRGLEVYFGVLNNTLRESAYAFTFPNRKLPTTATIGGNMTQSEVPHLISDTTTLCNQGPTFGYDIGAKKCTPYTNACAIPENQVEVPSCSANDTSDDAIRADITAVQ